MAHKHQQKKEEKPNIIKYNFPIKQVKKMIGKKLIILMPNIVITIQDKNMAKLLKHNLLENTSTDNNSMKNMHLILTAMYNEGVWQIFKNIDTFLGITSISYKELSHPIYDNVYVIIHQYPKFSKSQLKKLI